VGGWRRLHNEELHKPYVPPYNVNMINPRRIRWADDAACTVEIINVYKNLMGKPKGNRSFRRPRHRWEDNIRTNLKETGWEGVDWIHLAKDRGRSQDALG
jgi:hypothetical protein